MGCSSFVFLISQILLLIPSLPVAQPQSCSNRGTYPANSTYSKNLNLALSFLPSNITLNGGFYNASAGQDPDIVYALAQCRGDLSSETCYNCTNFTSKVIISQCPYQKESIMWGEQVSASKCLVRYSNKNIFAKMETSPYVTVPNPDNVTESLGQFNQSLYDLMGRLETQASLRSDGLKFATGDESYANSSKLYGLVQCTPDISQDDCRVCLQGAMEEMESCCGGKRGGRVLRPSCLMWFELFQFYDPTGAVVHYPPLPPANNAPPAPTPSTKGKKNKTARTVVIIVVAMVILVILIMLACTIWKKRRLQQNAEIDDDIKRLESTHINFSTLQTATDDFCDANKLGEGGFGSVYKGILPTGQEIAVKRLSPLAALGELDFKNEVLLVAKLQHRNLVSLLGFCSEGRERILVFEFVRNGSLDHFIFDPIKSAELNWEMRYKIINGIARGILYLHEDSRLRVIHCDLKASNVLLDEQMNPKISDFGIARLFTFNQTQGITSRVAGTYGYMAPEYAFQNLFSVKSDVFSFGVLILEIVSGKKISWMGNSEEVEHLLTHAWKHWREGTASDLIDKTLSGSSVSDIIRCIHIGLLCVQDKAVDRPNMASVVLMLTSSSHSSSLPLPSRPAFLMCSNSNSDDSSSKSIPRTTMMQQSDKSHTSIRQQAVW